MAAEFTERRQYILKLVVQEFVDSATAVASEALVRKYGLSISSATVRNELAALEDMGYLAQYHTSAGRVPTDAGYRFFVENLMDHTPLSEGEKDTIRHQFYAVHGELDQWIQLGAAVLARTTHNASVVTPPQAYRSRFKQVELIAIYETVVLLVLVLHDGTVKQQTFTPDIAYQQDELRRVSHHINAHYADTSLEQISARAGQHEALPPHLNDLEQQVLELIERAMRQLEDQVNQQIYSDGLIEMLSQPEFLPALIREEDANRAVERLRQILTTLNENNDVLSTLILRALSSEGVQVVIGGEHGVDQMRDYSVVLSRYGVNGVINGVLGIIGPTRMAYPRSISTVRYISTVMSDLLSSMYGSES